MQSAFHIVFRPGTVSRKRVPEQGEQDGQPGQERAEGSKENGDLRHAVLDDQRGGQVGEHLIELAGALGGEVAAAGESSDLLKGELVDAAAEALSAAGAEAASAAEASTGRFKALELLAAVG